MMRLNAWLRDAWRAGGTGGLNWHLHAAASQARWHNTQQQIDRWLARVQPTQRQLLLIGGSAGWMMSTAWLTCFKRVDVVDIDPLAPWLFSRRHGKALKQAACPWQFHRQDAIAGLPALLKQFPDAFVWFDNVLGQLRYRLDDEDALERQLGQIQHCLQGRSWGSVHDLYSGPTSVELPTQLDALCQAAEHGEVHAGMPQYRVDRQPTSLEDLGQRLLQRVDAEGIWQDHCTGVVFPAGTAVHMIPWAFKPRYCHWLELGWIRP
ncbi:MAG: hypothetical protein ACOVO0_04520 [Burkholderiaceae bacterium]